MKRVELFNDHFQNFKQYGIPQTGTRFYSNDETKVVILKDGTQYNCEQFSTRPTYNEVIDWSQEKGFVITVENDDTQNAFRSNLYQNEEKLYTSEWTISRKYALNDGIIKVLEDYL